MNSNSCNCFLVSMSCSFSHDGVTNVVRMFYSRSPFVSTMPWSHNGIYSISVPLGCAQGRLRVWSVIVTILGEIAQPEGGKISMASLLEICAALNIEPQAVRTAMSRLSKDGLVVGKREGRTAHYQFSPQGLAEYCRAATVIYAAPKSLVDWVFAFAAEGADAAELQKTFTSNPPLVLGGRCYVWPADSMPQVLAHSDADFMVFECQPLALSNWAKASLLPALNIKTCQRIGTCCQDLRDGEMTPDQARVARVLLIHFWRRLVLRY